MPRTPTRKPQTPDPLQKYGIIIGVVLGLIFGLLAGLFIPVNMPFDDCDPSVSFSIDNNFELSVFNGTDGTPIHEDSDQFECLLSILSIIEFDPVIIQAYQDNATGTPLNETITENIGTYMSYKNVFMLNAWMIISKKTGYPPNIYENNTSIFRYLFRKKTTLSFIPNKIAYGF